MQLETQKLIGTWYEVATGPSISVGALQNTYFQFMALWVAFNALYDSKFSHVSRQDWEQIDKFAEIDEAKTRYCELLRSNVEYRESVACLREYWAQKIRDENSLKQVLSTIQKVRNNLFHGRKLPGNLEGESLVRASYVIVSELMLMENFLNEP